MARRERDDLAGAFRKRAHLRRSNVAFFQQAKRIRPTPRHGRPVLRHGTLLQCWDKPVHCFMVPTFACGNQPTPFRLKLSSCDAENLVMSSAGTSAAHPWKEMDPSMADVWRTDAWKKAQECTQARDVARTNPDRWARLTELIEMWTNLANHHAFLTPDEAAMEFQKVGVLHAKLLRPPPPSAMAR
jgi:hypothetical protein